MSKPDWGHGPNEPVKMYTEDQVRKAVRWWLSPDLTERFLAHLKETND